MPGQVRLSPTGALLLPLPLLLLLLLLLENHFGFLRRGRLLK